jgi:hypothetical protein
MAKVVRTNSTHEDKGVWFISTGTVHYTFIYEPGTDPERISVHVGTFTDDTYLGKSPVFADPQYIDVPDPANNTSILRTIENYCWFTLKIAIEG